MSIWTILLGGRKEAGEKASSSGPLSLEQLESRLLLDANLIDPESSLSLDAVPGSPAIVVDLNQEGDQVATSSSTVLAVSDNSASGEPADTSEALLSLALPAEDPETTSTVADSTTQLNVQVAPQIDVAVAGSAVGSSIKDNESMPADSSSVEEPMVGQEPSPTLPRGPPVAVSSLAAGLPTDPGNVEPVPLYLPAATEGAVSSMQPVTLVVPREVIGAQLQAMAAQPQAVAVQSQAIAAEPLISSPPLGEAPYGATALDTSEYRIGSVWVTVVLLESNGSIDPSTEDWTAAQISQVKAEITAGLTWWEDTLHMASWHDTLHTLTTQPAPLNDLKHYIDFTYADHPVPTGYEPINRPAWGGASEGHWVDDFLNYVGYNSSAGYVADMYQWDHSQRLAHNTDWAFTIFVVNSLNDPDGAFSNGYFAYDYLGGPFLVMTYDNAFFGIDNMERIVAHESTHLFYAMDNSPGYGFYTDEGGYYRTPNHNAYDGNPDPGSRVPCLMAETDLLNAAYDSHTSSPSIMEMIGWKDSDSDGVFDVLDVPLTVAGTGSYNTSKGQYTFTGTSAVQTLDNLNPKDLAHDITTNTVDLVQYRIDDGPWVNGNRYGGYNVNISQTIPIASTSTLQLRTIVEETGESSPTITITGPEITVLGNGVSIPAGDTTPDAADGTNFGLAAQGSAPVSRMFTVRNEGLTTLTLGAVQVPAGFTVTEPLVTSLAPSASDTFTVQLDTTATGTKMGQISFPTNDSNENPFNFTITGTVTVSGAPAVTVTVAPSAVAENGTANLVYTFAQSAPTSSAHTVNFSVGGTASFGTDYTVTGAASFTAASGTVIIPANQTTAQVTVDPTPDTTVEPDETALLMVLPGTGYTVGSPAVATGTVFNDDGLVNLALGKTAVASSTDSTLVPSNATDGSTATRWSSVPSALDPQWIYVDLGAIYTINRIQLRWEAAYGRSYKLQVSNDPNTRLGDRSWPDASTVYTTTTGDGGVDNITLDLPTSGRYVQMLGIRRGVRKYGYSLWEFEVYGSAGTGAPEVTVLGNGVSIADGDTTPSMAEYTDFGSVVQGGASVSHIFTVRNDGTATLTLGTVTVPTGFTVTEGLSASLAAGASDTFTVQLDTTTTGTKTGEISFATNDSDENPFNFTITGTVTASGTSENLALGKTVVASSSHGNLVASNVTDGILSSRWSSSYSDDQWIYVDLGAVCTINRIVLRWETAYGSSYQLQVSDDTYTWSDVYSTTTGDGGVDDITLSAPATGRYVRMLGIHRATKYGYSLYEFEIYG